MPGPGVGVTFTKESLKGEYKVLLEKNPLLGRIEGTCKTIGFTEEEIRTAQLLVAVQSNASLQKKLEELSALLGKQI